MSDFPTRTALSAIQNKIGDFSSLEVIAFRGAINAFVNTGAGSANAPSTGTRR